MYTNTILFLKFWLKNESHFVGYRYMKYSYKLYNIREYIKSYDPIERVPKVTHWPNFNSTLKKEFMFL